MRYDIVLADLTPTARYTFATTTQDVWVRRGTEPGTIETETVPILDSYAAIIWADTVTRQPTDAVCIARWDAMQAAKAIEELRLQALQDAIDTARVTYPAPIDPNTIMLATLARRVAWLENEIKQLRGL